MRGHYLQPAEGGWPWNRERAAGVLEALSLLPEAAYPIECPPVPGRHSAHTPLTPVTAGLSVPRFPHYCQPRVWTTRPLRAQQQHGCGTGDPESCQGLGYSEAWAAPCPSFQGLLMDKLCLTCLLSAVGGEMEAQGHAEVRLTLRQWAAEQKHWTQDLGDLDSNPTCYLSAGCPWTPHFPSLCLSLHTSEMDQHRERPGAGVQAECSGAHGQALWEAAATARGQMGGAPPGAGLQSWGGTAPASDPRERPALPGRQAQGTVAELLTGPSLGRGQP